MRFKTLTIKMCIIVAAFFMTLPTMATNTIEKGKTEKLVYQDTNPSAPNYLKNRRALVGPGCTVNSVGAGVSVAAGLKDLQNLCNDNLDDYTEFPALVDATVAVSPVVSIKDNKHYYAKGTEAGFTICTSSDAGILKVDVSTLYGIRFFKDGEAVSDVQPVKTGQNITGLGLSLLTIPGNKLVTKSFVAEAPEDFDEVQLYRLGVKANVGEVLNIKYAFVGKARQYTITNNKENGIAKYAQEQGREPFTLEAHGDDPAKDGLLETSRGNLIDEDLTNYFTVSAVLKIGNSLPVTVVARPSDGKEAFPAGTEVGFKFNSTTALDLSIGNGASITLYDKNNKKIDTYTISATVLGLNVIKSDKNGELVLKAPKDFSAAKLQFPGVLDLKLGKDYVNYAFVRMAPDLATHHCAIEANSSRDVCGCENEYQLTHNASVPVTWRLVSQPADSNISLNEQTGKVTNIYVPGDYTFMAKAADGCTETTTIHYAPYYDPAEHGVTLLTNNASETKYELSGNNGGALLQLFGGIENASNVLNSSLNDYASVKAGVSLVENTGIIGIKSVDKSALNKNIDKTHKMQAGFVVTFNSTVLDLKALNLYNIQLYKDGKKVAGGVATHWGAISAGLIGSENTQKMRMSIDVPAGTDFDEIVLFNSGVIDAKLAKPNIYYAYVCDDEMDNASNNALYGAEIVSVDNTDASIDLAKTNFASVATIGSGLTNISNLIDNDMNTYITFPLGVDLNGAAVMVNVGKIVNKQQNNVTRAAAAEQNKQGQKIVLATNQLTLGLGVDLIKVLKVSTYLDDAEEPQEVLTDWKVLGADVIGTGGKGYVSLVTTKPFNKLKIEQVKPVSVANTLQIGGIALTSNINEDGTSTDCPEEFLVLDEDETLDDSRSLTKATMVFHRTFTTGQWNSLILPVDMTADQVKAAFGKDTKLAKFDKYDKNWIYFSPVVPDANGNMLEANIPYIIYPTSQPDYVNRNYNVGSDKEKHIDGPVYTVTGIIYGGQPTEMKCEDTGSSANTGMTHYGSYEYRQEVPAKSYMLSKGKMVHTSKVHNVKSYRSWLEETTPSEKTLQLKVSDSDNSTTGIKVIEEAPQNANAVYNVNGMRMNSSNTDNLPKGVYIINNKKVVIK